MKFLIHITALLLSSCNNQTKINQPNSVDTSTVTTNSSARKSQLYTKQDTVIISSKYFDTIQYSKDEFNKIIDNFPTLYSSIPVNPDISYAQSGYFKDVVDERGNKKHLSFGSEQGQDNYYILYAYFLRQDQGDKELSIVRENLLDIYQCLNDIFSYLQYGGTFFGHQFNRISAYAEYGVYEYSQFSDIDNKLTDIQKLKEFYIASLKEIIHKQIALDDEIPQKIDKLERENKLLKYVSKLDSLITDNFYLKKTKHFQYAYY